jgi:hypothetical protein
MVKKELAVLVVVDIWKRGSNTNTLDIGNDLNAKS